MDDGPAVTPMSKSLSTKQVRIWTETWLTQHAPDLLRDATLIVALPHAMIKKAKGVPYATERWFWNVGRRDAAFVLLIALDHAPADKTDIVVAEAYRVPQAAIGTRAGVARYKLAAANRVGSFLDPFRVTIPGRNTRR